MTLKFSIIIPVYNVAPYLHECLDSILRQTFGDWEAICIDDGSSDGSGLILDEYSAKDGRFRVIHQKNAGVSAARNAALDVVQGEWIWFVDGDDAVHPGAFEWLFRVFARFPEADSLMFRSFYQQENLPSRWEPLPPVGGIKLTCQRNSTTYYYARCTCWTTIYRRTKVRDLRFDPQYKMSEDTLFAVTYFWQTHRWIIAPARLYFYRQRRGSAAFSDADCQTVSNWLEVEIRLADLFAEKRELWNDNDMRQFFAWNRDNVWYSYRELFLRQRLCEIRQNMGSWVSLQRKNLALSQSPDFCRKIILQLVSATNSPFLCKTFILTLRFGERIRSKFLRTFGRCD